MGLEHVILRLLSVFYFAIFYHISMYFFNLFIIIYSNRDRAKFYLQKYPWCVPSYQPFFSFVFFPTNQTLLPCPWCTAVGSTTASHHIAIAQSLPPFSPLSITLPLLTANPFLAPILGEPPPVTPATFVDVGQLFPQPSLPLTLSFPILPLHTGSPLAWLATGSNYHCEPISSQAPTVTVHPTSPT